MVPDTAGVGQVGLCSTFQLVIWRRRHPSKAHAQNAYDTFAIEQSSSLQLCCFRFRFTTMSFVSNEDQNRNTTAGESNSIYSLRFGAKELQRHQIETADK